MNPILNFKNINKTFPGVHALKNVTFDVFRGTVHCLVGENGAGKSTLIKILSGAYQMDSGEIILDRTPVKIESPHEAQKYKISHIYQEQNLIPQLSVEENITLGSEHRRFGLVNRKENEKVASESLKKLSMEIDVKERVVNLSVAEKQMVAIAKALHHESKIIVMDEATSSLTIHEQHTLFEMITNLKAHGVTVIYISHNLDEIFEIGDYVTVLRDGEHIITLKINDVTKDHLIRMMVGRKISDNERLKIYSAKGKPVLFMRNLSKKGTLHSINIDLQRGEIIGVYGLIGSGRTELARVLFGADDFDEGEIVLENVSIKPRSPKKALRRGIALIPEDRRLHGIIGLLSVRSNISLSNSKTISQFGVIINRKDKTLAQKYVKNFNIKTPSIEQQVQFISGGNQQKIVISKVLSTNPKVLLMDEPTRGIDVGAKAEIFRLMRELADSGVSIIMFSSELPEVLKMSDRILVMYNGSVVKELDPVKTTQDQVLLYAIGEKS